MLKRHFGRRSPDTADTSIPVIQGSLQHIPAPVDTGRRTTKITVHPRSKTKKRSTTAARRLDRKPLTYGNTSGELWSQQGSNL